MTINNAYSVILGSTVHLIRNILAQVRSLQKAAVSADFRFVSKPGKEKHTKEVTMDRLEQFVQKWD